MKSTLVGLFVHPHPTLLELVQFVPDRAGIKQQKTLWFRSVVH